MRRLLLVCAIGVVGGCLPAIDPYQQRIAVIENDGDILVDARSYAVHFAQAGYFRFPDSITFDDSPELLADISSDENTNHEESRIGIALYPGHVISGDTPLHAGD